jgi:hypothetical protein
MLVRIGVSRIQWGKVALPILTLNRSFPTVVFWVCCVDGRQLTLKAMVTGYDFTCEAVTGRLGDVSKGQPLCSVGCCVDCRGGFGL